jgi:hypothetical protein
MDAWVRDEEAWILQSSSIVIIGEEENWRILRYALR